MYIEQQILQHIYFHQMKYFITFVRQWYPRRGIFEGRGRIYFVFLFYKKDYLSSASDAKSDVKSE